MSGIIQVTVASIAVLLNVVHPFHISVCDIDYDSKTQALQATHRLFLDDLERAINTKHDLQLDILNTPQVEVRDSLVKEYVLSHFHVAVDGAAKEGEYLGAEIEDGVWYSYIEIPNVGPFTKIRVTDSVLMEIFDDQVNLVHVKYMEKTRSLKLVKSSEIGEINYSQN